MYCGRKAPEVILEIDHIDPVANGGSNDILNLLSACKGCNAGKSDKQLTETAILDKQRAQLDELQERREQIDMMFKWQQGLASLEDDVIERLGKLWSDSVPGYSLNQTGAQSMRRLAKKYQIDEITAVIRTAATHYLRFESGKPTQESVEEAWSKVAGICRLNKLEQTSPDLKRLYYIRGIVRNRFDYCNDVLALQLLRDAHEVNASVDSLESFAKSASCWSSWKSGMNEYIDEHTSD